MENSDAQKFVGILKALLHHFNMSFLDLTEVNREVRVDIIKEAVISGKFKRESYTLQFYKELSNKPPRKGKSNAAGPKVQKKVDYGNIIVSFYLPYNKEKDIRTISISEDRIRLSTQPLANIGGRIFREIKDAVVIIGFDKKIPSEHVCKMLSKDVYVGGETYTFLGCSSGGLKNRKAFLMRGDKEKAEEFLLRFGKFDEIKSVSKKMARIGLLFSSVIITGVKIAPHQIIEGKDIEPGKFNFTDGCGGIGVELSALIYNALPDNKKVHSPSRYMPSVYQFRLHGYKGVLALDPQIPPSKILIRPSMVKFKSDKLPYFSVCGVSRPYKYGHLNRQLIFLLSSRHVPDRVFIELQQELFDLLADMFANKQAAITMLHWYEKYEEASVLLQNEEISPVLRSTLRMIRQSYLTKDKKVVNKDKSKEKLRIIVKKSRSLYGVADQTNSLEDGQCYVRVTVNGVPKVITGTILSGRTPCYLKGDLRILQAVDVPQLKHLVDCVVFPTKGKRPHADEQAGGDLDGDTFFITWDERLIPPSHVASPCYPSAASMQKKQVDHDAMVQYFALQNNNTKMVGLLDDLFTSWADLKGADCDECQWIGQLFGRAIDSAKTGEKLTVPICFLNPPAPQSDNKDSTTKFVWQILEETALEYKAKKNKEIVRKGVQDDKDLVDVSFEYVEYILEDSFTSLTEFEKFIFAWKFSLMECKRVYDDALTFMVEYFINKINFSLFSTIEKMEAIDLGVSPVLVMNGLKRSNVFDEGDLEHCNMLNLSSVWGMVFTSRHSDLDFSSFSNSIQYRGALLIVFQMPDHVSISLRITQQLCEGKLQCLPVGAISSFFISKGFGYRKEYQPKEDLYYDLYEGRFQIYRQRNVGRSFLSLSSQQFNFNLKGTDTLFDLSRNDLQDVLSVDLTSYDGNIIRVTDGRRPHPLVRKTPVMNIEVLASEDGVPMYPDVLIGNSTEVEVEVEDDDSDDGFKVDKDGMDDRDLCKILIDEFLTANERMLSLEDVKDTLKRFIATVAPWNCDIQNQMTQLLGNVNVDQLSWKDGFEILASLSQLGCLKLGLTLISKITKVLTVEDFFDILSDWTLVWFMDAGDFVDCLQHLKSLLLSRQDLTSKHRYLVQTAWCCVIEFIDDLTNCKTNWKRNCVTQMKLKNKGQEDESKDTDVIIHVFRSLPLKKEPILPSLGDHVLLLRAKDYVRCGNIVQSVSGIASVLSITRFPISMQLKLLDKEIPMTLKDGGEASSWIVVMLSELNIALYSRVMKACSALTSDTSLVIDYACSQLDAETPRLIKTPTPIKFDNKEELNITQQKAISASFSSIITCIQGPPGCGKTKCACAILKHAVKMYGGKGILAVAETNIAVDDMTRKLQAAGVKVVRIGGNLKKVSPDLLHTTVEGKLRLLAEREGKKIDYQTSTGETIMKKNLKKRVLQDADVILATCAGAGDVFLMEKTFKFVLVDEATQIKQATLLCALAHKPEQLVLIGDPLQLGPLVKLQQGLPWLSKDLVKEASSGLLQSLFHKLHEANPAATYLLDDTQYRMHPIIAQFSSDNFYDSRVKSGTTAENRKPAWSFGSHPVGFVHVDGDEKRHGTSYGNKEEQIKIEQTISVMLESADIRKEDITVLALYNGQVRSLRKSLTDIVVSSIDGFQGKENEYILVSTVRSNYNLGHTDDEKRMNVLLTRAKRGLLIFGHCPTLMTSGLWKKWIDSVPRFNI